MSAALAALSIELVLLGTAGGPGGHPSRAGIATWVQAGETHVLIDAGEGVAQRWAQAGAPVRGPGVVILTHLHDDHTVGLPALMSFAFTTRSSGFRIIGPPGTAALVKSALQFLSTNVAIRNAESGQVRDPATLFPVDETRGGLLWEAGGLRVEAVSNTHYTRSHAMPDGAASYSLRMATSGCSVAFTGDTGPSVAVAALARNVDLLVSEVASSTDLLAVPAALRTHMEREHLSPRAVGELATSSDARRVVLSHLRDLPESDLAVIRQHYAGEVIVGTDLQRLSPCKRP